jgi:carbonic anhydrase/acetyltransferase-like protein (isoleucine patch superfamily)
MILAFEGKSPSISERAFIAPDAKIIGDVVIEDDVSIWFGVVIRGDKSRITIKKGTNIQDLTMVHGDPEFPVVIDENVTIGHACIIHGCSIGPNSVIGMGSIVLNGAVIGSNSLVSAGSNVAGNSNFNDSQIVSGSPAKAITQLRAPQIEKLAMSAQEYIALKDSYIEQGIGEIK